MTTHEILHIIRNPWGWSEDEVRAARLAAADLIEQQAKEIDALKAVSKEMARVGMQQRNDLEHARNDISVMQAALRDADDYLSSDRFNEIGSGSILHRQMQEALTGQ